MAWMTFVEEILEEMRSWLDVVRMLVRKQVMKAACIIQK
jgi:hypothetical protein